MTDTTVKPVGRRDFLYVSAGALGGMGVAAIAWPFIDQMNPSAAARAAGGPMVIDLAPIAPGQQITVLWRSMPIFIVHRTPALLAALKEPKLLGELRDPNADVHQQPAYAKNWSRSLEPNYLVLVGICTHLGCIPTFSPQRGSLMPSVSGGYLCHCHGSKYDMAGRVFQGVPAPFNLPVPPYHFAAADKLVIGENPPGETYDLSSVTQL